MRWQGATQNEEFPRFCTPRLEKCLSQDPREYRDLGTSTQMSTVRPVVREVPAHGIEQRCHFAPSDHRSRKKVRQMSGMRFDRQGAPGLSVPGPRTHEFWKNFAIIMEPQSSTCRSRATAGFHTLRQIRLKVHFSRSLRRIGHGQDGSGLNGFKSGMFDLVVCNHVLEHVPDHLSALGEIRRVLKAGGYAVLQVPISRLSATSVQDQEAVTPEKREELYGQRDHVRVYGTDYPSILVSVGFTLLEFDWVTAWGSKKIAKISGLNPCEKLFVVQKSDSER